MAGVSKDTTTTTAATMAAKETAAVKQSCKISDKEACDQFHLKTNEERPRILPRRSIFDIRTDKMRTEGEALSGKPPRQGRIYSTLQAQKPGGIKVEEMIYGVKMAHLSCTDDTEDRLKGSSPNALAALEKLVGGDDAQEVMRLPLSEILQKRFGLKLDCWMDESGLRKGRAVDTQGFIASNDTTIVLSYRFSTTLYDWLANLSLTSSEWQLDKDEDLGHAGVFSSCRGYFTKLCNPCKESRPRVHTAYYNNFIYTIPMIREHIIDPLKAAMNDPNVKPKKVYIVGCSLGAAISQLAYCFILEELFPLLENPEYKGVDRLISITAGCPRIGDKKFANLMMGKVKALRPLDRAVICRIVYNNDVVPHGPPNILSFVHLDKMVFITKEGGVVMVNPNMNKEFKKFGEIKMIAKILMIKKKQDFDAKSASVQKDIKIQAEHYKEVAQHEYEKYTSGSSAFSTKLTKKSSATKSSLEQIKEDGEEKKEEKKEEEEKEEDEKEDKKEEEKMKGTDEEAPEEEEEDDLQTSAGIQAAFSKECARAIEAIHDHMPFWYMTYLEQLKREQDARYSLVSNNSEEARVAEV